MIKLTWTIYEPPIGPSIYKLWLNNSIVVGTVYMAYVGGAKYRLFSSLPVPSRSQDVFKVTGINYDTKEDAMDACENVALTWIKESKLLEEK